MNLASDRSKMGGVRWIRDDWEMHEIFEEKLHRRHSPLDREIRTLRVGLSLIRKWRTTRRRRREQKGGGGRGARETEGERTHNG